MPTMIDPPPPPARTSSSAVEVDVKLQPLDLYRAECAIVWRQTRMFLLASTILVLLRALAGEGFFLLVVVAVIGLFSLAVFSGLLYMAARSTLKTNSALNGPTHYSFDASGLLFRAPTYWGSTAWSNLHENLVTRHALILRTSTATKYIIPKRCLAPGDMERLRALARPGGSGDSSLQERPKQTSSTGLTIRVRLTADDVYRGFLTLLLRKSFWYAAQMAFAFLLIFALNPRWFSPIAFVVVGSIYIFYLAAYLYWASARAIRTNAAYRNELEYAFDESGLDSSGSTFHNHHEWSNFRSVIEDSKIFLFCPSSSQMVVVPKRFFSDVSQIEALRQLLRTRISGKLSLKR